MSITNVFNNMKIADNVAVEFNTVVSKRKDVHVTFLVDTSGSMYGEPIDNVFVGIKTVLNKCMHANDKLTLFTFSNVVKNHGTFPKRDVKYGKLRSALETDGGTSMFDAIDHVTNNIVQYAPVFKKKKVYLVIFTDGEDNQSTKTAYESKKALESLYGVVKDLTIILISACNTNVFQETMPVESKLIMVDDNTKTNITKAFEQVLQLMTSVTFTSVQQVQGNAGIKVNQVKQGPNGAKQGQQKGAGQQQQKNQNGNQNTEKMGAQNFRTKPCLYFLRGQCKKGDACTFKH
jgi:uncharacterized protein YegL